MIENELQLSVTMIMATHFRISLGLLRTGPEPASERDRVFRDAEIDAQASVLEEMDEDIAAYLLIEKKIPSIS